MEGPNVHSSNAVIDNGVFGTRTIRFGTSLFARQANGSAFAYLDDDITVFVTTMASRAPREHFDFFPLTVSVEGRSCAAGRIPGSFFRREGRPRIETILATQPIDRPLRPAFKKGMRNEVQVVATIMTVNPDEAYDALAINAASTATFLAGFPFSGPIGGTRMVLVGGQWVAFPRWSELKQATFSMVTAGRVVGNDAATMMVEAQAPERTDAVIKADDVKPTEAKVAAGMETAKPVIHTLCEAQSKLMEECGKPVGDFPFFPDYTDEQYKAVGEKIGGRLAPILGIVAKARHDEASSELTESVVGELAETFLKEEVVIAAVVSAAFKKTMHHHVLTEGIHMDGRTPVEIHTITAGAGVLPRVRGSALFQRGETQILGVTTLNMLKMEQQLDNLSPTMSRRYIHRYNFPPYSTEEMGRVSSPKRREIGRGHLTEIALESQLPGCGEFPYAIHQVSGTMGSNGSSPMGSMCAPTLSLYNADVPLRAPAAGITMDLVSATIDDETKCCTLADILGAEDALGDMDFKVAGTREHVTALRPDAKLDGIPATVLDAAPGQVRDTRFAILDLITEAVNGPDEMAATAPRIITAKIPVDKIGEVIGPKDEMINQIQGDTGAEISVEDGGTVFIGATNGPSTEAARQAVNAVANPQMPEVGERFVGTMVKTTTFGAFTPLAPRRDDLLHISQVRRTAGGKRVENVEGIPNVGDKVEVKIIEIDSRGKVSLHAVVEEELEAPAEQEETECPTRRERGPRQAPRRRHRSGESSGLIE